MTLHLPIQDPCHENWDAMNRDGESRRFCDSCSKHVHDLSTMTEPEARTVLAEESAKGRVCVRYKKDRGGTIQFRPQTVSAPSLWQTTLAAASFSLALLTGCTDAEPDRILDDSCVYEVGPWTFTAQRGQGSCPENEPEPSIELLGEIEPMVDPVEPPPPEPMEMGEAPPLELEPPPPPEHEMVMGKMPAGPDPALIPPEPELIEVMGDVAVAPDEPCEPKPTGPRRL